MSRILIVILFTSTVLFSNCNRTPEPANKNETPTLKSAQADQSLVSITLSGLMVLHQETNKPDYYEVGILPAEQHQHFFTLLVGRNDVTGTLPKDSRSLSFEIRNFQPTTTIKPDTGNHTARSPDVFNGQEDFDWIIDLENSTEFPHTGKLDLTPGVLWPIIHLPNGRLYTKYKSIELMRCRGGGGCKTPGGSGTAEPNDFGFVPEAIVLDIVLQPNQELILKDEKGNEVPSVKLKYSLGRQTVDIRNVREPLDEQPHFNLYYELLFQGVKAEDRYDFVAKDPPQYFPYNPRPRVRTCCQMECTSVLLGSRKEPLP